LAQIVELRAADGALGRDLDTVEARRVNGEGALDADAVGGLPNGEGLTRAGPTPPQHRALEHLDALLVALDDAHVDLHGVAGPEGGHALAPLLGLYDVDRVHETHTSSGRRVHGQG